MEKAKRDWYYEYNGIKAERSWIIDITLLLSTPFPHSHWIINSAPSFANDILLAAGIPRIPSTSNPTDKELLITYPFGLLIAAWTFTKSSAAYILLKNISFDFKVLNFISIAEHSSIEVNDGIEP